MLGHGGVILTAVDPNSKRKLANMCLYHDKTPALDQLTAIALAVSAGEEAEIMQTANLSRVTAAGRAHPLVQQRGHGEARWRPRDDVARKNEAYWQDTRDVWTECIGVFVLGRMWRIN